MISRTRSGLDACRSGAVVRLTDVTLEPPERRRLAELGLRVGATLTVIGRTAGGGRVVALGATRIALDGRTAGRLHVEPAA